MRQALLVVAVVVCSFGCDDPTPASDGGTSIKPPPQVFLTFNESNVIGNSIKGKVNVSGCKSVAQVQLLESGKFLYDLNYMTSPTEFELPAAAFTTLWPHLGFAASMTFTAYVQCDDARKNTSQPVGVTFFPVANKFSTGVQVMPDSFVVEGGLGGSPVTFLGCVGTNVGTALGRANTSGEIIASNTTPLPVDCSYGTQISDRSTATGTRWVLEPGVAAYAIDSSLKVVKTVSGKIDRMGVDPKRGSAILYDSTINVEKIIKADPVADTSNDWTYRVAGIMNSNPVIDSDNGVAWVSTWQRDSTGIGDVVTWKFNLLTGQILNLLPDGKPPRVLRQNFGQTINQSIQPEGFFSANGDLIYLPLLTVDASNTVRTTIVACSSYAVCDAASVARRWSSRTFDGVVNLVMPFSKGNYLAAVGPYQAWFLDAQFGIVRNLGEQPIRPSGNLQLLGVQPGLDKEVYLLSGPVFDQRTSYPVEAIAVDDPASGELWRFQYGSGESPNAGLYLGVDEGGQAWVRVGIDQVKPNPLKDYRTKRGPTVLP